MLQNSHILLRAIEPEDLDALYTIENNPAVWNVGNTATPYSRHALSEYIKSQPSEIFQTGQLRLAIVERSIGSTIGFIDLFDYSPLSARAEIGIAVLRECQQQGYGAMALQLLEDYARRHLMMRFLYAHISKTRNAPARRLFEGAGYTLLACLLQWHHCAEGFEDVCLYQKFL